MVDGLEKNLLEGEAEEKTVVQAEDAGTKKKVFKGEEGDLFADKAGKSGGEDMGKKRVDFLGKMEEKVDQKKGGKVWLAVLGVLILILGLLGWFGVRPGYGIYLTGKRLIVSGQKLQAAVKGQNLAEMKQSLGEVKGNLLTLEGQISGLGWAGSIPGIGGYQRDALHGVKGAVAGVEAGELVVDTVAPYADIVGLDGGQEATSGAQTSKDRINFVVTTIAQVQPQLSEIGKKMEEAKGEMSQIDPARYPEDFRGVKVRQMVQQGIDTVEEMSTLTNEARPLLEMAPYIMGIDGERTYLLIFQNDKELRPTGGFMTAYAIVKVKQGKVTPVISDDIYALDDKFKSKITAPDPILKYLPKVPYWYMRDMNLSPDFRVSMEQFMSAYEKTGSPKVDGVIALDTFLLLEFLKVLGPVGVPAYGTFSAQEVSQCSCPQVIYELESFADKATPFIRDDRKAILGPLMNSILANAMGSPKEKMPGLFEAMMRSLQEKHVLFYFPQEAAQQAVEAFNVAGRVVPFEGDYLMIVDTNFAGAKSNLYVEQQVEQEIKVGSDGSVTKTLTIDYKNPQKHDGWLNGEYRDWFRIYVPEGSELVEANGSEVAVTTSKDLGKTVFEGFFTMRPLGVAKLTFTYKLPFRVEKDYKMMVQKQAGTDEPLYTVSLGKRTEEFKLATDKKLNLSL